MNKKYDAIIIGAGVIGSPIAYELARMGYKTLNIDKLSDAGEGSTAASCAIDIDSVNSSNPAVEKIRNRFDFADLEPIKTSSRECRIAATVLNAAVDVA